jgi:hypothetical protein
MWWAEHGEFAFARKSVKSLTVNVDLKFPHPKLRAGSRNGVNINGE